MIKALTVSTSEIDDVEAAVADITGQLEAGIGLMKNSIGLISCYYDFIESGVVAALSEALPFEVVGTTTVGTAAVTTDELVDLVLLVLTSDDVSFVTGLTDPIPSEDASVIERGYAATVEKAGETEKPALMLTYAPLLMNVGGDFFVDSLSKASGNVPLFGTVSVDDTMDFHNSHVIFGGDAYKDKLALVLMYGNVSPKFYLASISKDKIFREKGVVTSSEGNQLKTINDISVQDYLMSLGLTKGADGTIVGVNSYPFVVDYGDGTMPVVRIMFAITPEGYAVCGGDIPEGATLSVGSIDDDEVVKATGEKLLEITADGTPDALLIFSCTGRYFVLGYDDGREAAVVRDMLGAKNLPFSMIYSGGEICPTYAIEGAESMTNRFHNDTFAVCAFY
ncbi:MAG: FIST C-terminal domain-containing protein [Clostridiales Family XIII bacterium]|jgi:hypothetical protein|nr:FIST C-terminal domain-containing protein [Clostridiales Family XIII bacterium]